MQHDHATGPRSIGVSLVLLAVPSNIRSGRDFPPCRDVFGIRPENHAAADG
jgi:hypothetical protein